MKRSMHFNESDMSLEFCLSRGTDARYMEKDTYDADGDGIVDNAARLGGHLPSDFALAGEGGHGITPHIGENGNWWIGSTDTGVYAEGRDGLDGRNGIDGHDGAPGEDGYTPQKGVDYFTEADIAEIVARVRAAIGEGEETHTHEFTVQSTDSRYLAQEASCKYPARYYYSCACGERGTATFESGDTIPHSYGEQKVDANYLVSEATCTTPARYNYSCVCGERGTATFLYGEALGHDYNAEGICTRCGAALSSERLAYTVNEDGASCTVTGIGSVSTADVTVPATLDGYTVTHIGDTAFSGNRSVTSIQLPDSVTDVEQTAFAECEALERIVMGSGVQRIGMCAFLACNALTAITIHATTPPAIDGYTFYEFHEDCTFYVPSAALSAYKTAAYWSERADRIVAIEGDDEGEDTHTHTFTAATCTTPKTCSSCGVTEGEALGHDFTGEYQEDEYRICFASCTEAETYYHACTRCREKGTTTFTVGEPLGHDFVDGVCSRCGATESAKGDVIATFTEEELHAGLCGAQLNILENGTAYYANDTYFVADMHGYNDETGEALYAAPPAGTVLSTDSNSGTVWYDPTCWGVSWDNAPSSTRTVTFYAANGTGGSTGGDGGSTDGGGDTGDEDSTLLFAATVDQEGYLAHELWRDVYSAKLTPGQQYYVEDTLFTAELSNEGYNAPPQGMTFTLDGVTYRIEHNGPCPRVVVNDTNVSANGLTVHFYRVA